MNRSFATILVVLSSACAPGYGPADSQGYGYQEDRRSDDRYRVRFVGGQPADAADHALLRSAELSIENGYPYFVVERVVDKSVAGHEIVSGSPTPTGITADGDDVTYTWKTPASGTTTLGAQVLTIRMLRARPEGAGFVYDADAVRRSLRRKLGLD